jgi:hypothetical protein
MSYSKLFITKGYKIEYTNTQEKILFKIIDKKNKNVFSKNVSKDSLIDMKLVQHLNEKKVIKIINNDNRYLKIECKGELDNNNKPIVITIYNSNDTHTHLCPYPRTYHNTHYPQCHCDCYCIQLVL